MQYNSICIENFTFDLRLLGLDKTDVFILSLNYTELLCLLFSSVVFNKSSVISYIAIVHWLYSAILDVILDFSARIKIIKKTCRHITNPQYLTNNLIYDTVCYLSGPSSLSDMVSISFTFIHLVNPKYKKKRLQAAVNSVILPSPY